MEEIAAAAGVARQTVYAHFPTRDALLGAVIDRVTGQVLAAIEEADLDTGPAGAALRRWLDVSWGLLARYPVLLQPAVMAASPSIEHERHLPIMETLLRLIQRGQRSGEFDRGQSPTWLVAATVALGHAAGQEVSEGRLSAHDAGAAFRDSVLRIYLATAP